MSHEGLEIMFGINLDRADAVVWIEAIVTEVAELSVLKDSLIKIREGTLLQSNNNIFKEILYKNMYFSYITRLARIIEPCKKDYKDDFSLNVLLKQECIINRDKSKDIVELDKQYKQVKNFRDKEIAHFTTTNVQLNFLDLDKILLLIQNLTNKYLYQITGNEIEDWEILINFHSPIGLEFHSAKYYDEAWRFF